MGDVAQSSSGILYTIQSSRGILYSIQSSRGKIYTIIHYTYAVIQRYIIYYFHSGV